MSAAITCRAASAARFLATCSGTPGALPSPLSSSLLCAFSLVPWDQPAVQWDLLRVPLDSGSRASDFYFVFIVSLNFRSFPFASSCMLGHVCQLAFRETVPSLLSLGSYEKGRSTNTSRITLTSGVLEELTPSLLFLPFSFNGALFICVVIFTANSYFWLEHYSKNSFRNRRNWAF